VNVPDRNSQDVFGFNRQQELHRINLKRRTLKKAIATAALCLSFAAGAAFADKVRDWHDLEAVHKHVNEAIHEMERARAANHYDMDGHGAKAEEHLRAAERELNSAVEAAKAAR
jgi:hypothetical protein